MYIARGFCVMSNQEMYHVIVADTEPLNCQRQRTGILLLSRIEAFDLPRLLI
jgi:hypothetical protein